MAVAFRAMAAPADALAAADQNSRSVSVKSPGQIPSLSGRGEGQDGGRVQGLES